MIQQDLVLRNNHQEGGTLKNFFKIKIPRNKTSPAKDEYSEAGLGEQDNYQHLHHIYYCC